MLKQFQKKGKKLIGCELVFIGPVTTNSEALFDINQQTRCEAHVEREGNRVPTTKKQAAWPCASGASRL